MVIKGCWLYVAASTPATPRSTEFNLEVKGSCFVLDPFTGSVRVMQYSLLPPPSDQKNTICKYQTYAFLSIA